MCCGFHSLEMWGSTQIINDPQHNGRNNLLTKKIKIHERASIYKIGEAKQKPKNIGWLRVPT